MLTLLIKQICNKLINFWKKVCSSLVFLSSFTSSFLISEVLITNCINCAYDSLGRDVLKSFFCTDIKTVVQSIIKSKEESIGIELTEDFRTFLCFLYTEGIAGMIINTAQHPKDCSKEKLIEYF